METNAHTVLIVGPHNAVEDTVKRIFGVEDIDTVDLHEWRKWITISEAVHSLDFHPTKEVLCDAAGDVGPADAYLVLLTDTNDAVIEQAKQDLQSVPDYDATTPVVFGAMGGGKDDLSRIQASLGKPCVYLDSLTACLRELVIQARASTYSLGARRGHGIGAKDMTSRMLDSLEDITADSGPPGSGKPSIVRKMAMAPSRTPSNAGIPGSGASRTDIAGNLVPGQHPSVAALQQDDGAGSVSTFSRGANVDDISTRTVGSGDLGRLFADGHLLVELSDLKVDLDPDTECRIHLALYDANRRLFVSESCAFDCPGGKLGDRAVAVFLKALMDPQSNIFLFFRTVTRTEKTPWKIRGFSVLALVDITIRSRGAAIKLKFLDASSEDSSGPRPESFRRKSIMPIDRMKIGQDRLSLNACVFEGNAKAKLSTEGIDWKAKGICFCNKVGSIPYILYDIDKSESVHFYLSILQTEFRKKHGRDVIVVSELYVDGMKQSTFVLLGQTELNHAWDHFETSAHREALKISWEENVRFSVPSKESLKNSHLVLTIKKCKEDAPLYYAFYSFRDVQENHSAFHELILYAPDDINDPATYFAGDHEENNADNNDQREFFQDYIRIRLDQASQLGSRGHKELEQNLDGTEAWKSDTMLASSYATASGEVHLGDQAVQVYLDNLRNLVERTATLSASDLQAVISDTKQALTRFEEDLSHRAEP
eukprot:Clim_evm93s236 gene=Clim_evmTU93s236